jgi:Flp pilus assembly protein CpaB
MRRLLPLSALLFVPAVPSAPLPTNDTVTVFVAREDLPAYALLREPETLFKVLRYARGDEPPGAVTRLEDLRGKRLKYSLRADRPVTKDHLCNPCPPRGMQAVEVWFNPEGSNSIVPPGSRADVFCEVATGGKTDFRPTAEGLLVLALDLRVQSHQGRMRASVTLAATPETAERLRIAETVGDLSLQPGTERDALREPGPGDLPPLQRK